MIVPGITPSRVLTSPGARYRNHRARGKIRGLPSPPGSRVLAASFLPAGGFCNHPRKKPESGHPLPDARLGHKG
jgi:hypothetical protein